MPFGLLSLVVMPFGLEALPLAVMALGDRDAAGGLELRRLASRRAGAGAADRACVPCSSSPSGCSGSASGAGRWRLLGLPAIGLGLLLIPLLIDPPDILVAPDGTAVAVRDDGGILRVSGARAGSYIVEQFFDEEGGPPADGAALREGMRCDASACLLLDADGDIVSHVLDPSAFAEDCEPAAVVATRLTAPTDCAAPLVIDAARLSRFGAHAIRVGSEDGKPIFRVTTDRSATPRPWQGN